MIGIRHGGANGDVLCGGLRGLSWFRIGRFWCLIGFGVLLLFSLSTCCWSLDSGRVLGLKWPKKASGGLNIVCGKVLGGQQTMKWF